MLRWLQQLWSPAFICLLFQNRLPVWSLVNWAIIKSRAGPRMFMYLKPCIGEMSHVLFKQNSLQDRLNVFVPLSDVRKPCTFVLCQLQHHNIGSAPFRCTAWRLWFCLVLSYLFSMFLPIEWWTHLLLWQDEKHGLCWFRISRIRILGNTGVHSYGKV